MINQAKTKIICNRYPDLKIVNRKIMDGKRIDRRTWVLYCHNPEGDLFIDVIDTLNQDLHNKELPLIKAIFECPKRQELRKQGIENKFELQIS